MIKKERTPTQTLAHIGRYYLLFAALSFLGWLWETVYVSLAKGRFCERGFMSLPFCPIYGVSLMSVYFLLGTPGEKRGILRRARNPFLQYAVYLFFAFFVPSLAELFVGAFFDKLYGIRLWNYSTRPWNIRGYVCLPVSLFWAGAIVLVMRFLFPPLKRLLFRIGDRAAVVSGAGIFLIMAADMLVNFII